MVKEDNFDLIIFGGGISGLYFCYKYNQQFSDKKILLIENKPYFGGRLKTKEKNGKKFDVGGVRFSESRHKRLFKLFDELNIDEKEFIKIPEITFSNRLNISNPKLFIKNSFEDIKIKFKMLSENTVAFFLKRLGIYDSFMKLWGYQGNIEINQADFFMKNTATHYGESDFYYLNSGFEIVINKLLQKLKDKSNITLKLSEKVQNIKSISNTLKSNKLENKYLVQTSKSKYLTSLIVSSLPPFNLNKINFFEKYDTLLSSVASNNYIRIFGEFLNDKTFYIHSDDVIPQIIGREDGIVQMAYADSSLAKNLRDVFISGQFKKLWMDSEKKLAINLGKPKWIESFYWKRGAHFWKPFVNVSETYQKILRPDKNENIFIIGEAFSKYQAWVEGSLDTSDDVLNLIKTIKSIKYNKQLKKLNKINKKLKIKLKNKSTKLKKWITYRGVKYDISQFINRHPGGKDAILFGNKKDITDIFDNVGHSKHARMIMTTLPIL